MLKKLLKLSCCIALAIHLSGCIALFGAAAGGAGTAFWLSGKLRAEVVSSYERTREAAVKALASLKMEIEKETRKDNVTQIISKYPDGRQVWVDIRPLAENSTQIEIRVGVKGDKPASTEILERIKKYL